MPYILREERTAFQPLLDEFKKVVGKTRSMGQLNYLFSSMLKMLLDSWGLSYGALNGIAGVLECVKLEMYRRVAAGYEDGKIAENGDVYVDTVYPAEG
jgi:hypothetical protein